MDRVSTAQYVNGFGEIVEYSTVLNGSELFGVNYSRDALGRITKKSETVQGGTCTYDYTYDLAGRLTLVRKNGRNVSGYTYGPNGNRLSHKERSGRDTGSYDDQDRLLSLGDNLYNYTASGELQSKKNKATGETTTYRYDALGNLTAATLPDGTRIEYCIAPGFLDTR